MSEVNVGDKVRIASGFRFAGVEGIVKKVFMLTDRVTIHVTSSKFSILDEGEDLIVYKTGLEFIDGKIISFDEIRDGDLIKVHRVYRNGSEVTVKGVVTKDRGMCHTEDNLVIATNTSNPNHVSRTIRLLNRPKIEWSVGTILLLSEHALTKDDVDRWTLDSVDREPVTISEADALVWIEENKYKVLR